MSWRDKIIYMAYTIGLVVFSICMAAIIGGCAIPDMEEKFKNGWNCKAKVSEPNREDIEVNVKIYNCVEASQ
jgi:hypothetical protein